MHIEQSINYNIHYHQTSCVKSVVALHTIQIVSEFTCLQTIFKYQTDI